MYVVLLWLMKHAVC